MKQFLLIISIHFCAISSWGVLLETMGVGGHTDSSDAIYVGILDEDRIYKKDMPNTGIDDAMYVAVPSKSGKFNGYTYYKLGFNRVGSGNSNYAPLPEDPDSFISKQPPAFYYRRTMGSIPELPDKCILPKGSLFFFARSGRGSYRIAFEKLPTLKKRPMTVRAKTIPLPEDHYWFEESAVESATYTILEKSEADHLKSLNLKKLP